MTLLWLIPAGLCYAFLLSAGSSGLGAPVIHGTTFNSMLLHLLQGRFDVDPATIGDEGFARNGVVFAYFGIFPALFRAPFLWLPGFAETDFTRLACLVAVSAMAVFKVLSVRLMWRWAGVGTTSSLLVLMTAAIVFGGPQLQFLRPSIYQEVELWAGALSAAFVYLVLLGVSREDGFTPNLLSAMALLAGLALLTRVSNALGLYLATGFVWLSIAWRRWSKLARLEVPLLILAAFVAIVGVVNYERWDNPLVFADFRYLMTNADYPSRLPLYEHYGLFNPNRIGFGLGYYFAPFWALRDSTGQFLGANFEGDFVNCCVELPASSFLVSDPLLLVLAAWGLVQALRSGTELRASILGVGLGLLAPATMMLTAAGMTFRYRMEFYPLFELFAFLGFGRLAAAGPARTPAWFIAGAIFSIVAALALWFLYMLSPFGSPERVLGPLGIVDFYRSLLR